MRTNAGGITEHGRVRHPVTGLAETVVEFRLTEILTGTPVGARTSQSSVQDVAPIWTEPLPSPSNSTRTPSSLTKVAFTLPLATKHVVPEQLPEKSTNAQPDAASPRSVSPSGATHEHAESQVRASLPTTRPCPATSISIGSAAKCAVKFSPGSARHSLAVHEPVQWSKDQPSPGVGVRTIASDVSILQDVSQTPFDQLTLPRPSIETPIPGEHPASAMPSAYGRTFTTAICCHRG